MAGIDLDLPRDDPWRSTLTTLAMICGRHVQVVHLNEPVHDGVSDLRNGAAAVLQKVVTFCRDHDTAIVLEPEETEREEVEIALQWLQNEVK